MEAIWPTNPLRQIQKPQQATGYGPPPQGVMSLSRADRQPARRESGFEVPVSYSNVHARSGHVGGGGIESATSPLIQVRVRGKSAWQMRFKSRIFGVRPSIVATGKRVNPAKWIVGVKTFTVIGAAGGKLPTFTMPFTPCTAGKFVTSTCVGVRGEAAGTSRTLCRDAPPTQEKVSALKTMRPVTTIRRMVYLHWGYR
jgi:hypothetical protein